MRANILSFFLLLGLLAGADSAFATDYYWVRPLSSGSGIWNDAANWSLTNTGSGGAGIPDASDVAIFTNNSKTDCTINSDIYVTEIRLDPFFAKNLIQNAEINAYNLTIKAGTLTGGTQPINVYDGIAISGNGKLISTTGTLTLIGSTFSKTGGTFTHNGGTVVLEDGGKTINGTLGFNNLNINATSSGDVTINNTISVANDLSLLGTSALTLNTGTITLEGNLLCSNTGTTGGGTALINLNGTNQTITGASAANICRLPKVTLSSTGTVNLQNTITLTNDFTNNANALNAGTSTVVLANGVNNPYTISGTGATTFNNLEITPALAFTLNVDPSTTFSVANTLNFNGTGAATLSGGAIYLQKDLNIDNANISGGSTALVFNGTSNQTFTGTSVASALLPAITIAKNGGSLILPASLKVGGNWTYTSGTIDANTNNATVTFANNNLTISGTHTLKNVKFLPGLSETQFTIAPGTNLNVSGGLTLDGTTGLVLNGGTIAVAGDVINNNSASTATAGGTATIEFNGTASQAFGGRSNAGEGKYPNIVINKASGTLNLPFNTISLGTGSDWTYTRGNVNAGVSTVKVFDGGTVFTGSHTLNKLNFAPVNGGSQTYTIATGTTITLNDNLTIEGNSGADVTLAGGEIKLVSRDVVINNTSSLTGGTTLITMAGSANQVINGSGTTGQGSLPKLKIDKASGTLFITQNATVSSELIMNRGNVDLTGGDFTLGTSTSNIGTLSYTAGTLTNGNFSRWYNTNTVADNSDESLFPMGTTDAFRPIYVATSAPLSAGGTIKISHTDGTGTSSGDLNDGKSIVTTYSNAAWDITAANGLTASSNSLSLRINPGNIMEAKEMDSLRIVTSSGVKGTHGGVSGTAANPSILRTGLSVANLSSSFRIGSTESTDPLPVEMVAFSAKKVNETVVLNWQTASEKNNEFFTVERSANGRDFAEIAKVKGAGTTSAAQYYTSIDSKPLTGTSYYRLVQKDFDGTTSYSKIVKVTFGKAAIASVVTYPNPATETLQVNIEGVNGKSTLEIHDIAGKLMLTQPISTSEIPALNVANFPQGIYVIRVYSEKEMAVSKFIKQ